jgi:hypothetical protein
VAEIGDDVRFPAPSRKRTRIVLSPGVSAIVQPTVDVTPEVSVVVGAVGSRSGTFQMSAVIGEHASVAESWSWTVVELVYPVVPPSPDRSVIVPPEGGVVSPAQLADGVSEGVGDGVGVTSGLPDGDGGGEVGVAETSPIAARLTKVDCFAWWVGPVCTGNFQVTTTVTRL